MTCFLFRLLLANIPSSQELQHGEVPGPTEEELKAGFCQEGCVCCWCLVCRFVHFVGL